MSLAYDRRGCGPTLVLLHGLGHHRHAWEPVLPALTPLDGPIWTLTPDWVLCRDEQPIAQVQPPGGTVPVCGAVLTVEPGRVGVALVVALPDGRRFVAEGLWRAERSGEVTKDRT